MSKPENCKGGIPLDLVQDASDESVGYQPKGYELLDELFLVCPSCNKKLVSLVLVKKLDKSQEKEEIFRAKCLKCGVNSFKKVVKDYKLIFQAVPPMSIIDMDTVDNFTEFMVK